MVENAAKYSNEGTTITIKADFCCCADYISIKVINEGIGIKEEDYEHLFTTNEFVGELKFFSLINESYLLK